jgi:hypothetical protein
MGKELSSEVGPTLRAKGSDGTLTLRVSKAETIAIMRRAITGVRIAEVEDWGDDFLRGAENGAAHVAEGRTKR